MIHASDAKLLVTRHEECLVIRDVDSRWRPLRVLFSLPFVLPGILVLYTVLSGAGMAEARSWGQWVSKSLFLGIIGLLLGVLPLISGLRMWLVREEIVIDSSGRLSKHLLLGPLRLGGVVVPNIRSSDLHIRTLHGAKTGTRHELVHQAGTESSEIRLLSFKSSEDAQQWKERISSYLSECFASTAAGEQGVIPTA